MSAQWHPDAEALAKYQAGLAGSFRGRRIAAHVADCARCASVSGEFTTLSSVLASAPAVSMPDAVERQIVAALATEAATRQVTAGQADTRQGAASPAGAGPAGGRPRRPRTRGFRLSMAAIPAAACLVLAGFGYLLSQTGSTAGPSPTSAGAAAPAHGAASPASVPGPAGRAIAPSAAQEPLKEQPRLSFVVIASGTSYHKATLAAQVRAELNGSASSSPSTSPTAGNQASAAAGGSVPSPALAGCVLHLTRNALPRLVDRATYQGEPAYVIAVAGQAWVVGPGCTASHPELITSVALPILPAH